MSWTATAGTSIPQLASFEVLVTFTDGNTIDVCTVHYTDADDLKRHVQARIAIYEQMATATPHPTGPIDISPVPPTPPPPDPRAGLWAILKTYDPANPNTPKSLFNLTDTIGVTVEIRSSGDGTGSLVPFTGEFSVPVFKDNGLHETVWVKRIVFSGGTASLTVAASDLGTGFFGIDDTTSSIVHATKQMITVQEA